MYDSNSITPLQALELGARVRRTSWPAGASVRYRPGVGAHGDLLMSARGEPPFQNMRHSPYQLTPQDTAATDWVVVFAPLDILFDVPL